MNNIILNHINLNEQHLKFKGVIKEDIELILPNQFIWDDGKELWWDDGKDMLFNKVLKVSRHGRFKNTRR